mgnify:CR=1 FL=1
MGAGASASSGGDSLGTNLSVDFSKSDDEVAAAIRPYYLQDPERVSMRTRLPTLFFSTPENVIRVSFVV